MLALFCRTAMKAVKNKQTNKNSFAVEHPIQGYKGIKVKIRKTRSTWKIYCCAVTPTLFQEEKAGSKSVPGICLLGAQWTLQSGIPPGNLRNITYLSWVKGLNSEFPLDQVWGRPMALGRKNIFSTLRGSFGWSDKYIEMRWGQQEKITKYMYTGEPHMHEGVRDSTYMGGSETER